MPDRGPPAAIGTMPEAIARWSATTPEAPALLSGEHGDAPVSYAELARRAALLAGKLREAGFARGDLVAIAAEPRVPAAIAMFAAMNVGAALPLLPSLDATELRAVFARLAPAVCVASDSSSAAAQAAYAANVPILTADSEFMPSGAAPEHRRVDPLPEDVALVLHSSGSTGSPRGIPRTHRNLLAAVAVYPAWTGQEALARVLVTTPLSFGMGAHALCATLFAGGTAILPGTAPERILRAIQRWRPTWGYIVSSLLEAIVAAAERSDTTAVADWRTIGMSGMAPVSGLDERVQARLGAPFAEAYGCGEAGLIAAATRGGAVSELDRIFSAGVMTVDEAGESTAPGTPGEIVVWGEQVSRAYLGDPAATAIAFDREGRFHTGDIGVLDGFGALRLIGRTKEIINRGGEKLAPAEIDAVLHAHPAVAAAAAFPVPDSRLGEEVGAAVVLHRGATATERELRRFAARRLAPAKVPRRIWIVDALPRTGSGKVRRLELALRLREARAG